MEKRIDDLISAIQDVLNSPHDDTEAIAIYERHCQYFTDALYEEDFSPDSLAEAFVERDRKLR